METREQIWDEFFTTTWTAEDGLTRLDPKGVEVPMNNQIGQETPRNDNGILFLSYFLLIARCAGLGDKVRAKFAFIQETIERLVRFPHRGLFNRRAAGDMKPSAAERHDNYVAIAGLSGLMGLPYGREILSYGSLNGWNYNNVYPETWDLEAQRQGGEIAYYWLCIGATPGFLEYLWLIVGTTSNLFTRDHGKSMLTWHRLYILFHVKPPIWWVSWPLIVVSEAWKIVKEYQFGTLQDMFGGYFRHDHPTYKMAGHVNGWGF